MKKKRMIGMRWTVTFVVSLLVCCYCPLIRGGEEDWDGEQVNNDDFVYFPPYSDRPTVNSHNNLRVAYGDLEEVGAFSLLCIDSSIGFLRTGEVGLVEGVKMDGPADAQDRSLTNVTVNAAGGGAYAFTNNYKTRLKLDLYERGTSEDRLAVKWGSDDDLEFGFIDRFYVTRDNDTIVTAFQIRAYVPDWVSGDPVYSLVCNDKDNLVEAHRTPSAASSFITPDVPSPVSGWFDNTDQIYMFFNHNVDGWLSWSNSQVKIAEVDSAGRSNTFWQFDKDSTNYRLRSINDEYVTIQGGSLKLVSDKAHAVAFKVDKVKDWSKMVNFLDGSDSSAKLSALTKEMIGLTAYGPGFESTVWRAVRLYDAREYIPTYAPP